MFSGQCIQLCRLDDTIAHLVFDRKGDVINKLDKATLLELEEAISLLETADDVQGILISSAKESFIVGADIKEFKSLFNQDEKDLLSHMQWVHGLFCRLEDLRQPSVVAVNGMALGGGLELALCGLQRVMAQDAQVGVPEVNLGIFPAYGGTVRLSRLTGPATAIDWITDGKPRGSAQAIADGVVDFVSREESLHESAIYILRRMMCGEIDLTLRRERKRNVAPGSPAETAAALTASRQKQTRYLAQHLPAGAAAIEAIERGASCERNLALNEELRCFLHIAKSQAAGAMIQGFFNQSALKKLSKQHLAQALPIRDIGVLGAGIMGGGIAFSSALKGMSVRLKDISRKQLDLGISEATNQLGRLVASGRLSDDQSGQIMASIIAQTDDAGFGDCDLVVEAVVERLSVKHVVLTTLEQQVAADAIIASNTSSLRIDDIAAPLQRPNNFVGMHFFNPVPAMPLVEIIRGTKTSNVAIATAAGYAISMGKTPIVVRDCPGFLVNRILTPYIRAFLDLVAQGVDFARIDRVMEAFGWPMGPAYLMDVIGIDTGCHVFDVISSGYPAVMPRLAHNALAVMVTNQRYGQKSGVGFYRYEADPTGKQRKTQAPDTYALLRTVQPEEPREVNDEEIVERLMLCSILEAARALEDNVVETPGELDIAMRLGIGYPQYLGGPLKYADWLGLPHVLALSEKYGYLGAQYRCPTIIRTMASQGKGFHD